MITATISNRQQRLRCKSPAARIQFTPDMIPGDITGTDIFVPADGHFRFIEGPVFHEIILADEINRAPPKVQSALLEAMQEHQVTVAGTTRKLPDIFLVMATQNPIEQEGTYPLPEAQLDRFIMKVELDYPDADEELEILKRDTARLRGDGSAPTQAALRGADIATPSTNSIWIPCWSATSSLWWAPPATPNAGTTNSPPGWPAAHRRARHWRWHGAPAPAPTSPTATS
jgi:hypothetical protein